MKIYNLTSHYFIIYLYFTKDKFNLEELRYSFNRYLTFIYQAFIDAFSSFTNLIIKIFNY